MRREAGVGEVLQICQGILSESVANLMGFCSKGHRSAVDSSGKNTLAQSHQAAEKMLHTITSPPQTDDVATELIRKQNCLHVVSNYLTHQETDITH